MASETDVLDEHQAFKDAGGKTPFESFTAADLDKDMGSIEWLYHPYILMGFPTMIAGYAGVGKTSFALHLAAAALGLRPWPDESESAQDSRKVVWLDTEGSHALLIDRLKKWGLPLDKFVLNGENTDGQRLPMDVRLDNPEGLRWLVEMVTKHEPRLVVIDSWRAAQGTDENTAQGVGVWKEICRICSTYKCPVLVIHHTKKIPGGVDPAKLAPLQLVSGHNSLVQFVRSVLVIDQPDLDIERLRVRSAKNNLARKPDPFGMQIHDAGVVFGPVAEEAQARERKGQQVEPELRALLANGPIRQPDVMKHMEALGIPWITVTRNKPKDVISRKGRGENEDHTRSYWELENNITSPVMERDAVVGDAHQQHQQHQQHHSFVGG